MADIISDSERLSNVMCKHVAYNFSYHLPLSYHQSKRFFISQNVIITGKTTLLANTSLVMTAVVDVNVVLMAKLLVISNRAVRHSYTRIGTVVDSDTANLMRTSTTVFRVKEISSGGIIE